MVQRPEGLFASDQTRKIPRTSNRGIIYISVFYIHDPKYIKGIPIKSRKKEEFLRSYKEVYAYGEIRGFKPQLQKWIMKRRKMFRTSFQANKQTKDTHIKPSRTIDPNI